ncbi:MAG: MBL fold metallo-hydrolase, partial [Clostridiales bacterium]|nr:MBL fold metallo-hydrolase [Clostridiales bacterium]
RDRFKPYEKNHSTVKEASELAETLGAKNLVLYHTEDKTIATRKADYTAESKAYYHGNIYVPDDLETIELG